MPPWTVSVTTQVSRYQKGKTNLDLLEQEIVNGTGMSWAMCKSTPRPRQNYHASIPPLSCLQAGCPSCHPSNSVKALKANVSTKLGNAKSWCLDEKNLRDLPAALIKYLIYIS